MSVESNQDETSSFVTTSNDYQEVTNIPQEGATEEQASSEVGATEGDKGVIEGDLDNSGTDAAAEPDKPKKVNGVQKRIDQVVRERENKARENERLKERIAELEGKTEIEGDKSGEPKEADFETYDLYLDALDAFDNKQTKAAPDKAPAKADEPQQSTLTDNQKTAMAVIRESVELADKPADFEAVALNPEVPITGDMLEALAECDDPAKVMYHLGQNKDLAAEIAAGSAAQQMRAIAKLDMTVTSKPPKPTKITNAPEPINPISGSGALEKPLSEMSFSEYETKMNKQAQKRNSW